MDLIKYLTISSLCLGIFYAIYKLAFNRNTDFKQARIYLISAILLSIVLPFNNFQVDLGFSIDNSSPKVEEPVLKSKKEIASNPNSIIANPVEEFQINSIEINWNRLIAWLYISTSLILFARIIIQFIILISHFINSPKRDLNELTIAYNSRFKNALSFFNIVFINEEHISKDDFHTIISHEKIHAQQYHSLDLILIELLSAVMWFNPIVWLMRSEIKLVHEYLADEGALSTGIDRLGYQALLVNQLTEERLICLSSSFNPAWPSGKHSLKKRMIMMTKSKFNHKTKLRILALLPVTLMLFLGIACVNGQNESNVIAAIEPVKMNVLYVGVPNPIKVAVSGYESSELDVAIKWNGTISGSDGNYIIKPRRPGNLCIVVTNEADTLQETVFRVKPLPRPHAEIAGKSGGRITKDKLLTQKTIDAVIPNFDFDLSYEIVEFIISTTDKGNYRVGEKSNSYKLTKKQKDLILEYAYIGKSIFIHDIKCKGPDGIIKKLPGIVFEIVAEDEW